MSGEILVALGAVVLAVGLVVTARALRPPVVPAAGGDVFRAAAIRDLRFAIDLYQRERGRFPDNLEGLVADRWIRSEQVRVSGQSVRYAVVDGGRRYVLEVPTRTKRSPASAP
jgi:hypothetical protein